MNAPTLRPLRPNNEPKAIWPYYAPLHVPRVRRGVFACVLQRDLSKAAWDKFQIWKDAPSAHPDVTEHFASQLVELIRSVFPVIPGDWLITTPPPGKSAYTGREYPAGFLAKAIANKLDREFLTVFEPQAHKKYRGRFESLKRQETFELLCTPPAPVIVVDDLVTSGHTLKICLCTLERAGVLGFAFSWCAF